MADDGDPHRRKFLGVATCALGAPVALAVTQDAEDGGSYSSDLGDAKVAQYRAERAAADLPPLPAPHPLRGKGENFEIVANVPIDFGADIEMGRAPVRPRRPGPRSPAAARPAPAA